MKKLGMLLVVAAVLAVSLPAYGNGQILIYKVSAKMTDFDIDGDEKLTERYKGYLVVEPNWAGGEAYASIIWYGKDDDGEKWYLATESYYDANGQFGLSLFWPDVGPYGTMLAAYGGTHIIPMPPDDGSIWLWMDAVLSGKCKPTNIGTNGKVPVARGLKGQCLAWPGRGRDFAFGTGSASLKLHTRWTREANEDYWGVFWAQCEILVYLEGKGYDPHPLSQLDLYKCFGDQYNYDTK